MRTLVGTVLGPALLNEGTHCSDGLRFLRQLPIKKSPSLNTVMATRCLGPSQKKVVIDGDCYDLITDQPPPVAKLVVDAETGCQMRRQIILFNDDVDGFIKPIRAQRQEDFDMVGNDDDAVGLDDVYDRALQRQHDWEDDHNEIQKALQQGNDADLKKVRDLLWHHHFISMDLLTGVYDRLYGLLTWMTPRHLALVAEAMITLALNAPANEKSRARFTAKIALDYLRTDLKTHDYSRLVDLIESAS